jgi:hypothetical protein
MGLLDDLYFGHRANFGGQNGGLLDFLRNTQMQQDQYQPSGGFAPMLPPQPETEAQPIQVGGVRMPRIGGADQFNPEQVNIPLNAQPTSGQLPMPTQQQPDIGFGDRIGAGLMNFANAGGLLPALAGGLDGLMTGQRSDRLGNANQTAQFLVSKGIDPALAKSIVSDPATLRSVLPSLIGTGGQTDDIKEYNFARQQEPNLTFQQFMARKRAVSGEYSLTPQYGTDAQGNTVLIQTGKSGEAIQTKLPAGVKISSGVEKIDLGTSWGLIDKRNGNLVGTQAKDIEGKESQEEVGKARGLAQVALPNAIASAEQTLKIIKDIKDDPYRAQGTGASSIFNSIPATGGYDFAQKLEQLKGKAFLEAFTSLKGGGAITEIEGKKAENAIARLSPGQSEGAFLKALDDLEEVVTAGIERAKVRAGKGGQPSAATSPQASSSSNTLPAGWSVRVR